MEDAQGRKRNECRQDGMQGEKCQDCYVTEEF